MAAIHDFLARAPDGRRGMLEVLEGENPYEVVPRFARAERFEELTGEYEPYRGIASVTVERHGGAPQLTSKHALGEESMILLPAEPERPGSEFEIPTMSGAKKTATFEAHDDHVDLYYDRNRLHKQTCGGRSTSRASRRPPSTESRIGRVLA